MQLTLPEIDKAFLGTDFGSRPNQQMLQEGLLKVACGYYNGYTLKNILIALELTKEVKDDDFHPLYSVLTEKGKKYLYECYGDDA